MPGLLPCSSAAVLSLIGLYGDHFVYGSLSGSGSSSSGHLSFFVCAAVSSRQLHRRASGRAGWPTVGLAWAERIALGAPLAIVAAKRAIDEGAALPIAEGLAVERACYAPLVETTDRVEALTAFREKRPPRFEGR